MLQNKEYTSNVHTFLRAEAFCAAIAANGIGFNEIRLLCNSNFKKSFRNEIDDVSIEFNEATFKNELVLTVNKDGFYDKLPEGLFHQSRGNSKTSNTGQMADEHRRFKEEEKLARKFFQPIEQEIFRYSILVEQEEVNLAFDIINGELKSELLNFWNITPGLPTEPVKRLVQIMPWAKKIKGNATQTAKALEYVLAKLVTVSIRQNLHQYLPDEDKNDTTTFQLGIDTVLGNHFWEPSANWLFTVGEVEKNDAFNYLPYNGYGKLLKQFEEIFIPLQIDIIFDLGIVDTENVESEDILGLSLII